MKKPARNLNRTRTERQLIRMALRGWGSDRHWRAIVELQMRGSPQTLELARSLSASASWRRRGLGLCIASQLRQHQRGDYFGSVEYAREETQTLLLAGLHDPHDEVVRAAVSGLGHRPHPDALPELLRLSTHRNELLRWNVAVSLGHYPEPDAIEALLWLASDPDDDVRNWATFGLGSLQEADTPEIRELLWKNLQDRDDEVRGEALVGLAKRSDPRAITYLAEHLDADCRVYELEAAEKLASPLLVDALQRIADDLNESEVSGYWLDRLNAAIDACRSH
ncbi:HEAT repeat domain-containing protein [Variovorax sp. IB41]|uniref:HEAT repeat domain-containing protein n=1 Tax=Variovorax sp. IB41 TaxID=2779370 RepID=UPI0018E891D8|nr:HEAT repeat domain-containing protein [Variovorax sp. IB41]MBJ2157314.1 HEAT repeat domain-containing protein [Variovorax sp. IB41]